MISGTKNCFKPINLYLLSALIPFVFSACQPEIRGAGAARPAPVVQKPVASVNGQGISEEDFHALLVKTHGREVLNELILLQIVRQEADRRSIADTPELLNAELERLLEDMAPQASEISQDALLDFLLRSRGLTRGELNMILTRRALLRQMIDRHVELTEAELRAEFQRLHGPRRTVRLISAATLRQIEAAQRQWQTGGDFTELVQRYSEDQRTLADGGLLSPFTATDPAVPAEIRQAAFAINETGQGSAIFNYTTPDKQVLWAILRLEEIVPPDDVSFEAEKEELRRTLAERIQNQRMAELQNRLRREAKFTIFDPKLGRP